MKNQHIFYLFILITLLLGCNKDDDNENNNNNESPGVLGSAGNEWNATFDGTNTINARIIENNSGLVKLEVELNGTKDTVMLKYDGNSVAEYVHSNGDLSKPFTMVEFDAEVGDIYMINIGPYQFEREVIEINSYMIDCLGMELETIGVYEYIPYGIDFQLFGYIIREIYWYWHQVYGLVCVEVYTEDGHYFEFVFVSIDL